MNLAREVWIFLNAVRAVVVVLALAAIGLFGRMSPAIEQILAENVISTSAVEEMLAVLALPEMPEGDARARFEAGLRVARDNLTERKERPILERIASDWEAAVVAQQPEARSSLVESLRDLAEVNRASMTSADREAGRLGTAGAWAVAFLSALILAGTQIFAGRLEEKVVQPLSGIEQVVEAFESGLSRRRCAERGAPEVRRIAEGLNRLLDLSVIWRSAGPDRRPAGERALLEHLLDARDGAWAAVDENDEVMFASSRGWTQLDGDSKLEEGRAVYAEEVVVPERLRLVRLDPADDGESSQPLD